LDDRGLKRYRCFVVFLLIGIFLPLCPILPPAPLFASRLSSPWLSFSPQRRYRGSAILATFRGPIHVVPKSIQWKDVTFPFFKTPKGTYQSLLAVPLSVRHKRLFFHLNAVEGKKSIRTGFALMLYKKRFPTRAIYIKKRIRLDEETLARIEREKVELKTIFHHTRPLRLWEGTFIKPVPGGVTSRFGVRRKINGNYLSIHRGVDFRASMGTPVHAINSGKVVLEKELVLSGKTIVIDHGMGLYSLYGHLSKFRVNGGDKIRKNQVIGLSGKSGRATGPHLHLGVILQGIAIDPLSLFRLPL